MWSVFSVLGGIHKDFFRETGGKEAEKLCSKKQNCSLSNNILAGADHHWDGNTPSICQSFPPYKEEEFVSFCWIGPFVTLYSGQDEPSPHPTFLFLDPF